MTAFATASTVDDALAALASGARPIAGGTDLVVGARQGKAPLPESLVAIHRLEELRGIDGDGGGLRVGALATHRELAAHAVVRARYTAVADAAAIVGSHATRAHGTLGGNLMNASPAMETGGPLMCLDAACVLRSATGSRLVAVADLLTGPGTTNAAPEELLVAVDASAAPRADGKRLRPARVPPPDGDRRRRRDRGREPRRRTVVTRRIAITALAPTIRRVPRPRRRSSARTPGRDAVEAAAAGRSRRRRPDLRRPRLGALPAGDGRP